MALIHSFGDKIMLTPFALSNDASVQAKIKKALLKKKISEAHADAFLADIVSQKVPISNALNAVCDAVKERIKGKDTLITITNKTAKAIFTTTVLTPQFKVLSSSFDCSIHEKGGHIQLWVSYKGGGKAILVDTAAPG